MIKITKPGQKEFYGFCKWCGCEFTYEISDLKLSATSDKVSCPTCGKDYHHAMVQNPTLPGGIGCQWPSDSTDPCAGCVWRSNLEHGGVYIGDTPCTWCNKNKFNSITCEQPSIKDYTTPCVNQLDTYLTTSTSSEHSNVKAYNKTENKEDITQGTVMQTILNACNSAVSSCNICGDTEGCNSCSGEHKCSDKKNCKGKH